MLKKDAQQERSKRGTAAYSFRYGKPLREARTPLANFFSILLIQLEGLRKVGEIAAAILRDKDHVLDPNGP